VHGAIAYAPDEAHLSQCMRRLALLAVLACGCSSVRSTTVRTAPERPPYFGEVGVYTTGQPSAGSELGAVEVHALQSEATVETLVPLFVRKVAALGGNAAVIDHVRARFDIVPRPMTETYTYACAFHVTCVGTRTYWVNEEVLVLSVEGRAIATGGAP
jgi:hypothetical protein